MSETAVPLESVPVGSTVEITAVDGGKGRGSAARRALELGFVVGALCRVVRKAPFGGPLEVEIGRSRIGVRPADDLHILVRICSADALAA